MEKSIQLYRITISHLNGDRIHDIKAKGFNEAMMTLLRMLNQNRSETFHEVSVKRL